MPETFEKWHNAARHEHRTEYMRDRARFEWTEYEDWLRAKYAAEQPPAEIAGGSPDGDV